MDFSQPQWCNFGSEVIEFIMQCIEIDVKRRPTANQLLQCSPLMQLLQQKSLNYHNEKSHVVHDFDRNCFKLHMQLVLCQSIQQKLSFNNAKIKAIQNLERHFLKVKDKAQSAASIQSHLKSIQIPQSLRLSIVQRLLNVALGVFETERFIKKLDTWSVDYEFSYKEIK